MRRTHLAKDDLDWLPPSYRLLRGAIVGSVWAGVAGGLVAVVVSGGHVFVFGKVIVALGAAGYWLGDRAAKGLIGARLGKLARGDVDLARLSNEEDGELVHVRGRVRAGDTVASIVSPDAGVYRRTRVAFEEVEVVDEEAVDFQLVDEAGHAVAVESEGARLLVRDDKLVDMGEPERLFPLAVPEAAQRVVQRWKALAQRGKLRRPPRVTASEVVLRPGDLVEVVGYKARKVDPTVVDRLARETPMRATLRAGRELPLILSFVGPRA